ncbi:MAG: thiamine pyrophosphate-dependent dehydrogenase E1 component subunit alpha [Acidobacteriota bacterium]
MIRSTQVPIRQLLPTDGEVDAPLQVASDLGLDSNDLVSIYRAMSLIRLLDQRMLNLQRQGRIGFYGAAGGEEAAVVGSAYGLRASDWIFPALRQGGAALMRGLPLTNYMAQCIGNAADPTGGRQMPCHYSSREAPFVSMSSCIGNQLPQATGAALAARIRGDDTVVMGYMGDGATSEPDFHVALNFAALFGAPVVFFCQNNQWAISLPAARQTASDSLAIKADAYGMPGVRVDGNDALAVYQASHEAIERARGGGGPSLIEAVTYRLGGHSSSDDPGRYRQEQEVTQWQARDPLPRLRRFLEGAALWDAGREASLEAELSTRIDEAVGAVEPVPPPPIESLFEDVYSEMPWHLREQRDQLMGSTPDTGTEGPVHG